MSAQHVLAFPYDKQKINLHGICWHLQHHLLTALVVLMVITLEISGVVKFLVIDLEG
jgi:hypothetical protein